MTSLLNSFRYSIDNTIQPMKLMRKGGSANISNNRKLLVSIKWNSAADFDLAAVWEDKKGNTGVAYYGDAGNPNVFPHICSPDESPGDIGVKNKESFLIHRPEVFNYLWIMCWDYEKIQKGLPAKFKESNILLTVTDDRGNIFEINPDNTDSANTALIATIDNTSPPGTKIINSSQTGMFNELKNLDQVMDFIRHGLKAVPSSTHINLQ